MIFPAATAQQEHTVWGLNPIQIHDRFWAARGVQVVRNGEPSEIVVDAELFLLTQSNTLAIFKLRPLLDTLVWMKPDVLYVRLKDQRESRYREHVITDDDGRFVRFDRVYAGADKRVARVAITPDREIATLWQKTTDAAEAWKKLRRLVDDDKRHAASHSGDVFDVTLPHDQDRLVQSLVAMWNRPDSTITRTARVRNGVWANSEFDVESQTRFVGPVWVGCGRTIDNTDAVVGPAVLWDDPDVRPGVDSIEWEQLEPTDVFHHKVTPRSRSTISQITKRGFDIVFALVALALTLPLYPIIMLAIWIEDGLPAFFTQARETKGEREFRCLKFRSMRRDADEVKRALAEQNKADGPQFFMDEDPRMTRVGRFIRATYLDELPQFVNVLIGDMSVVGPRPSPREENQFSPGWREARLSVRPGITGLWQISRQREHGCDFQEWIKYDLEYVAKAGWALDLRIIRKTVPVMVRGFIRSGD